MATLDLDLDLMVMFAALLADGSVLLELAVGDEEQLAQVRMPPSEVSRRLASGTTITLDLDDLPTVAPELAREIDEFVREIGRRLVERAGRQN